MILEAVGRVVGAVTCYAWSWLGPACVSLFAFTAYVFIVIFRLMRCSSK